MAALDADQFLYRLMVFVSISQSKVYLSQFDHR